MPPPTPPELRRRGPGRLPQVCLRQWRAERALRRRGVRFRDTSPERVAAAYAVMTGGEFDAVNGLQDWANWRTIPRALAAARLPDRPLRVLDLGCGTGSSTRVLAQFAPPGSHVTGYEIAAPLLAFARRRDYRHRNGSPARVDFVARGVTDPFPEPDGSVDVVNASGVVGHHLTPDAIGPLVAELRRVLSADGVAMLDVGPTLRGRALRRILTAAGFTYIGRYRSWFADPTGEMVFRRPKPE